MTTNTISQTILMSSSSKDCNNLEPLTQLDNIQVIILKETISSDKMKNPIEIIFVVRY